VEAVTAFSNKPLVTVFYLGCGISVLAGTAAAALVIHWLFLGGFLSGWPSLMVSIWLLGGLTIFCLGVLGIYLARVFMETKRRPYTVVKALYERSSDLKR
jgi:putative glycosyltransferase